MEQNNRLEKNPYFSQGKQLLQTKLLPVTKVF